MNSTIGITQDDALRLVTEGPSEMVEIRGRLTSARVLADLIAGFAHHQGGHIFFGYHRRKKKVVGCNRSRVERRYSEALSLINCDNLSSVMFFNIHDRQLCVVTVPGVNRLIVSPSGLVIRNGTSLRSIPKRRIEEILRETKSSLTFEDFGKVITALVGVTAGTEKRIKNEFSLWNKAKGQIVGFIVGGLLTAAVAYIRAKLN